VKNAQDLIGEVGVDMSAFPTGAYLCSWARVAPRPKESGGRRKGGSVYATVLTGARTGKRIDVVSGRTADVAENGCGTIPGRGRVPGRVGFALLPID